LSIAVHTNQQEIDPPNTTNPQKPARKDFHGGNSSTRLITTKQAIIFPKQGNFSMPPIFTPNEAAALVAISPKRIYKEIEYQIIPATTPHHNQLSFGSLVYLRALREIDFDFSVSHRVRLHQALAQAWEQQVVTVEFAKFFTLQVQEIGRELQSLIDRFETWKAGLVSNPAILGGAMVFPNSRLSVGRIGGSLERGESLEILRADYPYLTDRDFDFAQMYVKAYPSKGRPKVDEVSN
jgi:uncharacterized protein (DUF433 family)